MSDWHLECLNCGHRLPDNAAAAPTCPECYGRMNIITHVPQKPEPKPGDFYHCATWGYVKILRPAGGARWHCQLRHDTNTRIFDLRKLTPVPVDTR